MPFRKYIVLVAINFALVVFLTINVKAQHITHVGLGWANNSVNTVIFRKNSLVTYRDTQFIAFYNQQRYVVLGKRKLNTSKWELKQTPFRGNAADAHNTISIMVDGSGYLHLSWDHHAGPLHYARSISPGSLELTAMLPMTRVNEQQVTYPEFHRQANGDLIFIYRDGRSGQGNLIIKKYDHKTFKWIDVSSDLIDGEGKRNAYTQAFVDSRGTIHLSWVWRESPDVATNHDMCYARSTDGGKTWEKSNGEKYNLPITASTAECAVRIPQNSELINQTSMTIDDQGIPYIASYWRDAKTEVPQYHVIYLGPSGWKVKNLGFRKTDFSLSGTGTKKVPISRPQIIVQSGEHPQVSLIFRDEERGNKPSVAYCNDISNNHWIIKDIADQQLGSWEPSYDTELWRTKHIINLFVQRTEQIDGEGRANIEPRMISVLEWKP